MRIKLVATFFILFSLSSFAADPIPEFFFQGTYKIRVKGQIRGKHYEVRGSGFGISLKEWGYEGSRYLMTAAHVLSVNGKTLDDIEVEIQSEQFKGRIWVKASVVAIDCSLDIAVLKVEKDLPFICKLAKEDRLKRGDVLLTVGSPDGTGITPTWGVLVSKQRESAHQSPYWWQGSMSIYLGNSGGPVWDVKHKEIVGMAVSTVGTRNRLSPNVVFFVPYTVIGKFIKSDAFKKALNKSSKSSD